MSKRVHTPTSLEFFDKLKWLDGRPLLKTIEPYRQHIFTQALDTFDSNGRPKYNMVLSGRAKKNWKTADLILAGLYRLLVWPSEKGNDGFILANDEGQAGDDLSLAKKLVLVNDTLKHELKLSPKAITRRDGNGALAVLPANDVKGSHGKTYLFIGFDEIHSYRSHDLFEALAPDPTRPDVLTWITSYAGIRHAPGIPLYDFMQTGKRGDDPRMLFSWYAADHCTDPAFSDAESEAKANPSSGSWTDENYLASQKKRLPAHKYRRLHLNLPGAPDGAAFSGEHVMAAIVENRAVLPPSALHRYFAFVDMSGGSNDDAVLAVAHREGKRLVLDCITSQSGAPPFNPRHAVTKFAAVINEYKIHRVVGDAYGGQTFRADFEAQGVHYDVCKQSKHELYEAFEPLLTAGEIELLDVAKLQEQLLTLVWRGTKIDHQVGDHDDFANACCGVLAASRKAPLVISDAVLDWSRQPQQSAGPTKCFF
jgi:phage terminase large subunit-like protein